MGAITNVGGVCSRIEELMSKVVELHRLGTNSLESSTSLPSGEKSCKCEKSAHARIFEAQHSVKSMSQIMYVDIENIAKQISQSYETLKQEQILLDIQLTLVKEQTDAILNKTYPNLSSLTLSDKVRDTTLTDGESGGAGPVLSQLPDPESVLQAEKAEREAAASAVQKLDLQLTDINKQLQALIAADTAKINSFKNHCAVIEKEVFRKRSASPKAKTS